METNNNSSVLANLVRKASPMSGLSRETGSTAISRGAAAFSSNISNNSENLQKILDSSSDETRLEFKKLTSMFVDNMNKTGEKQISALKEIADQMEKIKNADSRLAVGFDEIKQSMVGSRASAFTRGVLSKRSSGLKGLRERSQIESTLGKGLDTEDPTVNILEENNKLLKQISENTESMGSGGGLLETLGNVATALMGLKFLSNFLPGGGGERDDGQFNTIGDPLQVDQTTEGGTTVTRTDGTSVQLEENVLDNTGVDETLAARAGTRLARATVGRETLEAAGRGGARVAGNALANVAGEVGDAAARRVQGIGTNSAGQFINRQTGQFVSKEASEAVSKNISKLIGSKVAKAMPGIIGKSIPFAGALIGLGQGLFRAVKGDLVGAALSAGSGVAGPLTAITLGAADIAREIYKEVYGVAPEDDPDGGMERLAAIGDLTITEMKKAWDNFNADETLAENTPEAIINKAREDGIVEDTTNRRGRVTGQTINQERLSEVNDAAQLQEIVDTGELSVPQQRMLENRIAEIQAATPAMANIEGLSPMGADTVATSTVPTAAAVETITDFASGTQVASAPVVNNITNNTNNSSNSSPTNVFASNVRNQGSSLSRYNDRVFMG